VVGTRRCFVCHQDVEKTRWNVHRQAHQRYTHAMTSPSAVPLTAMHSIRQPGNGHVARDAVWLQRGMNLGRAMAFVASTSNAYATIRKFAERREPGLEPATVDFAVGVASAMGAYFRGRLGGSYQPLKYEKLTQAVGREKAVPEMLRESDNVVDPELMPSGSTPPEEPRPSQVPPPADRSEEYQKRGYKVGKRLQSTVRRPERPVLEPPPSELQSEAPAQVPKVAAKPASEELRAYKIHRTPTPSSSSSSDESASNESRESRSLPRRRGRAESLESAMPKLTGESPVIAYTRESSCGRKYGVASRIRRSKKHTMVMKRKKRSKDDHGDGDIRDALRKFTEEFCRGGARRSEEPVGRCRVPEQSEFRSRDPPWSRSGWRTGVGVYGGARRGARR